MPLHWLVTFAASAAGACALRRRFDLDPLASWLIVENLVAFAAFGYDKAIAGTRRARVPERLLLAHALAGGCAGAFVAMQLFRHKTAKGSFRLRFWAIVAIEAAAVAWYICGLPPIRR
ncbi:MAG TPA: DUF1294 domain-containing protein [Planctomycetes bacterium]|nr:DUF1294 domain-containing protein [Planctomycetota bacterium]